MDCPCELTLRSVNVPTRLKTSGIKTDIIGEDGSSLFLDTISEEDFGQQDQFITKVPKGKVCVSGVTGAERYETRSGGTVLSVITGNQADSVFAHIGFVNCRGERAVDTLELHKQWCGLTLVMTGMELLDSCSVTLHGNSNGFCITDLSPREGEFYCAPTVKAKGIYTAMIPRQGDDGLRISFTEVESGEQICEYEIGELMADAGFDWNRTDLDDILINIDRAEGKIEVKILQWYNGTDYGDITI